MTAPVPNASSDADHRVVAGRYRLGDVLGRGAMGVVWQAEDTLLRRPVAVKEVILPLGLSPSEREIACERTLREARAIARLAHPNVVTLFDVTEEDGRPWVVMELVRARSLAQVVKDDGAQPVKRAAEIGLAVLAALEAAHAAGITHRDVKPGNILIGDDGRVKLTDFGIARSAEDSSLTSTGLLLGSPSYIAPEVVRGQAAGPASDLFGLGATLYAVVEGHPPFRGEDPISTLNAVASEPPEPYQNSGPLIPVLDGLLRKAPAERITAASARQGLLAVTASAGNGGGGGVAAPTLVVGRPPQPRAPQARPPYSRTPSAPPPGHPAGPAMAPAAGPAAPLPQAPPPAWTSAPPGADPAAGLFQPVTPPNRPQPQPGLFPPAAPQPNGFPPPGADGFHLGGGGLGGGGLGGGEQPPGAGDKRSLGALAVVGSLVAVLLIVGVFLLQGVVNGGGKNKPAPTPTSTAPGDGPIAVPAGYTTFNGPSGRYSVGVPDGWKPQPQRSGIVDIQNPTDSGEFLRMLSLKSSASALAALSSEEPGFAKRYPSYRKIRLQDVTYRNYDAAEWEFTFDRNGVTRHVLYRAFSHDGRLYGIYLSAPETDFAQLRGRFDMAAATFVFTG